MLMKPKTLQCDLKLIFNGKQKILEFFTGNLTFTAGS